ncbi:hypothetical protein EDB85DRAFT_1277336 [Lactarius pseudohatsudake]|nr:hypothetical protein EDB85DRAFT_1277336 [Lactarius pseudohatsudake]
MLTRDPSSAAHRSSLTNNLPRVPLCLIVSPLLHTILHGASTPEVLIVLSTNYYHLLKRWAGHRLSFQSAMVGPCSRMGGTKVMAASLHSGFAFLVRTVAHCPFPADILVQDSWRGVYPRWHVRVSLDTAMLRLVSSSIDYHRACSHIGIVDVRLPPTHLHSRKFTELAVKNHRLRGALSDKKRAAVFHRAPRRPSGFISRTLSTRRSTLRDRHYLQRFHVAGVHSHLLSLVLLQTLRPRSHVQKISRCGRRLDTQSSFSLYFLRCKYPRNLSQLRTLGRGAAYLLPWSAFGILSPNGSRPHSRDHQQALMVSDVVAATLAFLPPVGTRSRSGPSQEYDKLYGKITTRRLAIGVHGTVPTTSSGKTSRANFDT